MTAARQIGEMANAHGESATGAIGSLKNPIEQVFFLFFYKPSQRICAKIGDLDHAGKAAVYKHWCFYDMIDPRPKRPLPMKMPHQLCMFTSYCIVIVVY
jgi:hypothetical protein